MAVLWVTLHALGEPVSVPALVLAYNIGYLANALPIPGGIGILDAGLVGSLLLYGASPVHVTAAVLVYHAIALWIPGLGGTIAYLRVRGRLARAPLVPSPAANGGPGVERGITLDSPAHGKVAMAAFEHANRQWADGPTIDLGAAIAQAADEVMTLGGG